MNLMTAHNQWANRPSDQRFETLADLRKSVHTRRMRARTHTVSVNDLHLSSEGEEIFVNGRLSKAAPSNWAFGQLSQVIGAPAGYLRSLPAPLAVNCIQHGLTKCEREEHKLMTLAPESGDNVLELQAVTSTSYGRIWDADVVDSVSRIVERTNGKFFNPKAYVCNGKGFGGITGEVKGSGLYASDRDVFVFMIDGGSLLDAGPRAQLNRGFIVWNSEVGSKTFGLMTFLFNQVCGNHIIWGAQNVNKLVIRHTANGPYRFDAEAAPELARYAQASAQPLIDTVRAAQAYMLPEPASKDETLISALAAWQPVRSARFTRSEISSAIDFAKAEEGDCRTLWHLVQGATAYARGFDFIDSRVDLEKRAGSLLSIVERN